MSGMSKLKVKPGAPFLVSSFPDMGLEAWAKFDETAEVFEVFASKDCDDYIGCADTVTECRMVAREWFNERMSY